MRSVVRSLLVVALQFGFSPVGLAQGPARETLSLDQALAEARANNPEIQAARERGRAARVRIPQASALPDPTLGYTVMGPNFIETRTGPQDQVYEAEQMIPFPGKLWERRRMAAAEAKAAEAQAKAAERDVLLKVAETCADLYAAEASLRAVEEVRQLLRSFEHIAQARYASQGGSQADVAKAQAESSEALRTLFLLRQQREAQAAALNALLNRDPQAPPVDEVALPDQPVLSLNLSELLAFARRHRPELEEASSIVARDSHASALAKFGYLPDVSVGFQYVQIGGGMTSDPLDGRDAWMVPIKVTIPLWQNRLVSEVREAKRNLAATQAQLKQAENMTEAEVREAYARFMAARHVAALAEHALIPEAQLAARSAQAAYEAGETTALNLIDSQRLYLNAKISYYEAVAETVKSFAALERAVGLDLTNVPGRTGGAQ